MLTKIAIIQHKKFMYAKGNNLFVFISRAQLDNKFSMSKNNKLIK